MQLVYVLVHLRCHIFGCLTIDRGVKHRISGAATLLARWEGAHICCCSSQ